MAPERVAAPGPPVPTRSPERDAPRRAPRVQAVLRVGSSTDPAEREADRVAAAVVASLRSSVSRAPSAAEAVGGQSAGPVDGAPAGPVVGRVRRAPATAPATSTPIVGPEGGPLDEQTAGRIRRSTGGAPLDPAIRPDLERAFGRSFDDVRVHRDSDVAPQIGARAFTYGTDVHFAPGEYRPGDREGLRTLGHELTHVVQQTGGASGDGQASRIARAPAVVRRDIGFEFETKNVSTRITTLPTPAGPFADAAAGGAAWNDPNGDRLPKGAVIMDRADIEVQADDNGNMSDLEVVTTHFPETPAGRGRLDAAMADLWSLVQAHNANVAAGGGIVSARSLDGQHNFTTQMNNALFGGGWQNATTAPQVTMGIRVGNVMDIVDDLHGAPGETGAEKTSRDPGRLRMRRPDAANPAEPRATTGAEETDTLIRGAGMARNAVAAYANLVPAAPVGRELEGLLTIIYAYTEAVQHKTSFLKNHTPLMAKTDLATIWTTLPPAMQAHFGETNKTGTTNFEKLVALAPGYAAKMGRPVFDDLRVKVAETNKANPAAKQWFHKLTLKSWLRGIALRDPSAGQAVKQFFFGPSGSTKRRGVDQLTSANFPNMPADQEVEGYGALGANTDTHPGTNDALPVFELRSASRPITFQAARQWSLDLFDYIRSLNANPGGGHTRMT